MRAKYLRERGGSYAKTWQIFLSRGIKLRSFTNTQQCQGCWPLPRYMPSLWLAGCLWYYSDRLFYRRHVFIKEHLCRIQSRLHKYQLLQKKTLKSFILFLSRICAHDSTDPCGINCLNETYTHYIPCASCWRYMLPTLYRSVALWSGREFIWSKATFDDGNVGVGIERNTERLHLSFWIVMIKWNKLGVEKAW